MDENRANCNNFAFLRCGFSKVSSRHFDQSTNIPTNCICLAFLQYAISNTSSFVACMQGRKQISFFDFSRWVHNKTASAPPHTNAFAGCLDRLNNKRWAIMRLEIATIEIELMLAFPNMWNITSNLPKHIVSTKQEACILKIEITQNASLRLIWSHTPYEQCLDQWRHQYPQHIPTVDSFSPECGIMFPKVVGSLRVSGVSESQNHELYYSPSMIWPGGLNRKGKSCWIGWDLAA